MKTVSQQAIAMSQKKQHPCLIFDYLFTDYPITDDPITGH